MTRDEPPVVSVLMTAYNTQRYLRAALDSVLNQTMRDFELVVVDDGSTDRTPEILDQYAAADRRVRVVHRENGGISAAANTGLEACRGAYVARLDSDDIAKPDRLKAQLAYLTEHGLIACGTWHDLIDERSRFLKTLRPPTDDATVQDLLLKGHGAICNPTSMFLKQPFIDLGGYALELASAEDLDCWLRLGEVGKLGNVPQSLGRYRLHHGSVSEQKCQTQRDRAKIACERAWERRGLDGMTFEAESLWRPGDDRESRHRFALEYGWWAYNSGERATAASYGWRAIRLRPWHSGGWKLVGVTWRGRVPEPVQEPATLTETWHPGRRPSSSSS